MADEFDPFEGGGAGEGLIKEDENIAEGGAVLLGDEVTGDDLLEEEGDSGSEGEEIVAGQDNSESAAAEEAAAPAVSVEDAMAATEAVANSGPFSPSEYVPESDALIEWQTKHNAYLDEKASKESDEVEAQIAKAREELDEFYAKRDTMKTSKAKDNLEAEDDFVKARDAALTKGEPWERAAFFCDFQLNSEGRDTSRMRELMIQLKH